MKRRAFTIIELLVVVGIIALLGSLLVMAIGKLIRSQKTNATKADLQNIRALTDEMNAQHSTAAPAQWLWRNLPALTYFVSGGDFWKAPIMTDDPRGVFPAFPRIADCLPADPGAMTTDNPTLRNGSRAVLNTQLAMRVLLAFPTNKAAFAQLPADRWMIPTWVKGPLPVTGKDGLLGTTDDGTDTEQTVYYAVNNCVQDFDQKATPPVMRTYRCIVACDASVAPEPYNDNAAAPTNWVVDPNPTPVLLDAWNNPLIFVPTSGLINVYTNVSVSAPVSGIPVDLAALKVKADSGDAIAALPNSSSASPAIAVPSGGRFIAPIQSPDNRYFFASAGPDGDLSTGDDNMYSFEK